MYAFPLQQRLHERASTLRNTYIAFLVSFFLGMVYISHFKISHFKVEEFLQSETDVVVHVPCDTTRNISYRNNQQDATVYQNLLFHVYVKLNMYRATHRPSSGAQKLH